MRLEEHVNLLSQKWKKQYHCKVMKVGLSLGLTCPNRARGACVFCLPRTFTDKSSDNKNITINEQIELLVPKIASKTQASKYIAYLQDETSTACSLKYLHKSLAEIRKSNIFEEVIISTRPDYLDCDILDIIKSVNMPITIELGMQTIHDESLKFLNRNHSHLDTIKAIDLCSEYQIPVGVHLILGIPNENWEMNLATLRFINQQKIIEDIKIHNLVIYKTTKLAEIYQNYNFVNYTEYLDLLAKVVGYLSKDKTISRLFTSNLRKEEIAINPFPGFKQKWLKDLWLILKESKIKQGIFLNNEL